MTRLRDIILEGFIDARSQPPIEDFIEDRTYTTGKTLVVDGGRSLR